jgi:ribonuclease G
VVNCHPEVARILQGAEREELRYLMDRFNKTIQVKPQSGYHQEQFDIYGRQERVEGGRDRDRRGGRDRERERRDRKAEEPAAPAGEAVEASAASAAPGGSEKQ